MEPKQSIKYKVRKFLKETIRVLRITKKPDRPEFLNLVKVTGIGILIVGAIGFTIFMLKQVLL